MPAVLTDEVRARREKIVLDHFHDEVVHEWDDVLATFPHPRYEIVPLHVVYDGDGPVRDYYRDTRIAFPDQDHEMIALRHADDAVITEFYLVGTHTGPLGDVPPTGGRFKLRVTAFFVFRGEDELVCERIYFDQLTLIRQLMGAIDLKSPKGLLLLARFVVGLAKRGREPKDVIPDGAEPTVAAPEVYRG